VLPPAQIHTIETVSAIVSEWGTDKWGSSRLLPVNGSLTATTVSESFSPVSSHHIENTDAGLLASVSDEYKTYIKSINNLIHYGFRCHGDLPCNCICTLCLDHTSTYQDVWKY